MKEILEGSLLSNRSGHKKFSRSLLVSEVWPCRPLNGPNAETPGVTLHLNPGITLICFNPSLGFNCIVTALKSRTVAPKTRDEVPAEVCPGYKYKDDTILFPCIGFGPGFEYKPRGEFRDLRAAKQPSRTYSGI
jgi:hypothetical protein